MNYSQKYLKYKQKYIQLKNIQNGGSKKPYTITVRQPWFNLIKEGKKTVEGRLNKGLFSKLEIGDEIVWICKKLKHKIKVIKIKQYKSFSEMIKQEQLENVLPGIKNDAEGVKVYRRFYTEEDEKNYGVVAIGMSETTVHEGKLQSPYYEYIRDGVKIYELRVYDDKRKKIKVGDEWVFKHNDDNELPEIRTKITDIKIYISFEKAIEDTGYEKLLPNAKSNEEAIKIYNAFDNGNYEKNAKEHGVVRFTLKKFR